MAITPVEMAAFLPKSVEAGIVKQAQQQKPVNEQIILNANMKEQEKKESTQTKALESAEQPEYRYDGSGNGNGAGGMLYQRNQQQKKKKKEQMDGDQPISGIDIRI